MDVSTGKEAAPTIYLGLLCANLRPRENFSSAGVNLGEGGKQGATQASHKSRRSANTSPRSGLPVGTKHGNLLTVNMNFSLHFLLEQTVGTPALSGLQGVTHNGRLGDRPEPRQAAPSPGWAPLPCPQRAPGAVFQLFQPAREPASMSAPRQCAETAPRSATVPVFSCHWHTTSLSNTNEFPPPLKPGASGTGSVPLCPRHGDSTPCQLCRILAAIPPRVPTQRS